ncbi:MAG: hypothetical protein QM523_08100 [Candidatus Pacebacteria bacterium]|nr:hypothetical protein [Candidatus Paceibacterota bacterium]
MDGSLLEKSEVTESAAMAELRLALQLAIDQIDSGSYTRVEASDIGSHLDKIGKRVLARHGLV